MSISKGNSNSSSRPTDHVRGVVSSSSLCMAGLSFVGKYFFLCYFHQFVGLFLPSFLRRRCCLLCAWTRHPPYTAMKPGYSQAPKIIKEEVSRIFLDVNYWLLLLLLFKRRCNNITTFDVRLLEKLSLKFLFFLSTAANVTFDDVIHRPARDRDLLLVGRYLRIFEVSVLLLLLLLLFLLSEQFPSILSKYYFLRQGILIQRLSKACTQYFFSVYRPPQAGQEYY